MPIVGVEPGLKPGAVGSRNGKVGVMAEPMARLPAKVPVASGTREQISPRCLRSAQFVLQGCTKEKRETGLADQIELGELDSDATAVMH
ncbi:hypothetical protein ACFPC0_03635 [Streptomyces andamanensis]|uniref:Uncharacterized protein n=1 Tax=Streptomyces andamanensis TaxID=1565035 RepID=A0ABV8T8K9_9ACTN